MWWLFDPVVGDALRTVGHRDHAALAEPEGLKRAPHRGVVLVSVASQVVRVLSRKAENRPSNTASANRRHAVDDVILSLGMPCAVNLGIRLVGSWSEGENSKRPLIVGHKETVPARDVFLSVNPARVSVGPPCSIPIRLHERAGMRVRTLDESEVVRGCNLNLHTNIVFWFRHIEVSL